jgi:predicted anti-sigma-YlaC factor YlaD
MDCGKLEKKVLALCEGELSRERREALEEHLLECKRCASLTTDMRELWGDMSVAEDAELSQQFWPRLFRRIREYDAGEREGLGKCAMAHVGLRPITAVACLLLAIWAGIFLGEAYSVRVSTSVAETWPDAEEAVVPYLAMLDDLPHGSLAELFVQESILDGSEQ